MSSSSGGRPGSAADWLAFLDKAKLDRAVLFTSEGLSVGNIQNPRYAAAVCRAYNDYVHDMYVRVSDRLRPMALIPMQDPEAAGLGCALAVHGGANGRIGLESFSNFTASHVLHHSMPLMVALVALIYHGVFDRFPELRVGFMEGGCGWISFLLDRMKRDENYFDTADQPEKRPIEYLQGGRILIGCEGSEGSLAYVASRVGVEPFAYASDYPHEVDLVDGIREIEVKSNVSNVEEWTLVPGDLVTSWKPNFLVTTSREATDNQREEQMYYVECSRCHRTEYQIRIHGPINACHHYQCTESNSIQSPASG